MGGKVEGKGQKGGKGERCCECGQPARQLPVFAGEWHGPRRGRRNAGGIPQGGIDSQATAMGGVWVLGMDILLGTNNYSTTDDKLFHTGAAAVAARGVGSEVKFVNSRGGGRGNLH